MKAHWTHDCNNCRYLASSTGNGMFDWYECNDTAVARYGDDGPEYWSMPIGMINNDEYLIVHRTDTNSKAYNEMLLIARFILSHYR